MAGLGGRFQPAVGQVGHRRSWRAVPRADRGSADAHCTDCHGGSRAGGAGAVSDRRSTDGGQSYFLIWWATVGLRATRAVQFGILGFVLFGVVHWLRPCLAQALSLLNQRHGAPRRPPPADCALRLRPDAPRFRRSVLVRRRLKPAVGWSRANQHQTDCPTTKVSQGKKPAPPNGHAAAHRDRSSPCLAPAGAITVHSPFALPVALLVGRR